MGDGTNESRESTTTSSTLAAARDDDISRLTRAALERVDAPLYLRDAIFDELVQTMRIEATRYDPALEVGSSFNTWITIQARRRALDLLRLHARRLAHEESYDAMREWLLVSRGIAEAAVVGSVDAHFTEFEFWDAIDRALSKQQRELLDELLADTPKADIAEGRGIKPSTLSYHIAKLKRMIVAALTVIDL